MYSLLDRLCLSAAAVTTCTLSIVASRRIHTSAPASPGMFHSHVIKNGMLPDVYTANKLLTLYGKCGAIQNASQLFDEMPFRDTVSWNAIIGVHVEHKCYMMAFDFLQLMRRSGFSFDEFTFGSMLKGAASMNCVTMGCQLHSIIVKTGLDSNVFCGSALVDMYAKNDMTNDAKTVFELIIDRNEVTWNAMIAGYAQASSHDATFELLKYMERDGFSLDEASLASSLSLLDDPKYYNLVCQVHVKVIKYGRAVNTIAYNALITAYAECGSIRDSEKLFGSMKCSKDLVTWNSMLAGYAQQSCWIPAFELFNMMRKFGIEHDMYTYTSIVNACFDQEQQDQGKTLHGLIIKMGFEYAVPVSNSIIAMYVKSKDKPMQDAIRYFSLMDLKDGISWNSLLTGFSQSGLGEEALKFFARMRSADVEINHYSLSAVFRACSDLAVLQLGQQVHGLANRLGFEPNVFVTSSMMFMYSKCGVIDDARRIFNETNKHSTITWNSIIFAYAQHGQCDTALGLFYMMQENKVRPDHITFIGILSACSHIGLVEEGVKFLTSMESLYGIPPRVEHYACGVDLLGRAGHLDEAKNLIESMPFAPDAMVWKSLLGACRIHGNIELATYAARILVVLDPAEHSTYLILSDLYARKGNWGERAMVKRIMRDKGLKKVPGWSWIEVNNEVHAFNAEDQSHPQANEVYKTLRDLMAEIRRLGYAALPVVDHEGDSDWR